ISLLSHTRRKPYQNGHLQALVRVLALATVTADSDSPLEVRNPSSSFPRASNLQPLFTVTDRGCFLELGVRRLCLLSALPSPFVFRSRLRLRSRSSPFAFARRSPFAFTRCSPFEFAFVWKPRCSALNSSTNPRAPLSRRTALFCPRRGSLNPPPDNTLTKHQYSSSNSATSDFYYN
ncbi:hypothetical protein S245_060631, partial [Arachis hypogaea]